MPWKLTRPEPPSGVTLGVLRTKALQLREATGRLEIRDWSMVWATSVLSVSRSGDSLVTMTSVETEAGGRVTSTVRIWPTVRTRFLRSILPKPLPPAVTS